VTRDTQIAVCVCYAGFFVAVVLLARLVAWIDGWIDRVSVRSAPSTPDLLGTPPAVVNLLANRVTAAPEAAAATLLDLAARRHVELFMPGPAVPGTGLAGASGAGADTVVLIRSEPAAPTAYEERVLDRIRVPDGVRPLTLADLARRHASDGADWHDRLVTEVRADAAARGLVRPASSPAWSVIAGGYVLAFAMSWLLGWALLGLLGIDARIPLFLRVLFVIVVMVLTAATFFLGTIALAGKVRDERLTPDGDDVAAHWRGVAAWLRAHETFADLPPASVAVWDTYLAYGVALGVAPRAAATVDLRVGTVDVVRSTAGGTDRIVRVAYPSARRRRHVASNRRLILSLTGLVLLAALAATQIGRTDAVTLWVLAPTGAALAVRFVRLVPVTRHDSADVTLDTDTRRQHSDQILARARKNSAAAEGEGRTTRLSRNGRERRTPDGTGTIHAYLAVIDDGRSDPVAAWWVTPRQASGLRPGTLITARGQPWSRCLTRVEPRSGADPVHPAVDPGGPAGQPPAGSRRG
jgi:hypothetical protein